MVPVPAVFVVSRMRKPSISLSLSLPVPAPARRRRVSGLRRQLAARVPCGAHRLGHRSAADRRQFLLFQSSATPFSSVPRACCVRNRGGGARGPAPPPVPTAPRGGGPSAVG